MNAFVSALLITFPLANAQSPEDAAALFDQCSQIIAQATGTCSSLTKDQQDFHTQKIAETVGHPEQGGVQIVNQYAQLSQAAYESIMTIADQCENEIELCEQHCRTLPNFFQTCHHDLRERVLVMRSKASAAVITHGMTNQNRLEMTESGVDYAMGPRQGTFTIDVRKNGGGSLTPEEQAAFADKFNSDPAINNGTDGEFKGNKVIGQYDGTVTDSRIRKQASDAAVGLGMDATVVVIPDKKPTPAPPSKATAPTDPNKLIQSLRPTAEDLAKGGTRTPKRARPAYCAQHPTQTGC